MSKDFDNIVENLSSNTTDNSANNGVSEAREKTQEEIDEMMEDYDSLESQRKKEKRKKNFYKICLVIAIIIIIILLLKGCSNELYLTKNTKVPDTEATEVLEQEEPTKIPELEDAGLVEQTALVEATKSPSITIPNITSFIVSKEYPYKDLYNPETNKGNYYLQYSFTIDGEEEPFYQSKLVEAGYKFSVNFGELLDVGEYDVWVQTDPYTVDTLEPKSNACYLIKITVTE